MNCSTLATFEEVKFGDRPHPLRKSPPAANRSSLSDMISNLSGLNRTGNQFTRKCATTKRTARRPTRTVRHARTPQLRFSHAHHRHDARLHCVGQPRPGRTPRPVYFACHHTPVYADAMQTARRRFQQPADILKQRSVGRVLRVVAFCCRRGAGGHANVNAAAAPPTCRTCQSEIRSRFRSSWVSRCLTPSASGHLSFLKVNVFRAVPVGWLLFGFCNRRQLRPAGG